MSRELSKGQIWAFAITCYLIGFLIEWYWSGGIRLHVAIPHIEDWPSLAMWLVSPIFLGGIFALPLAWLADRAAETYLEMRARVVRAERRAEHLAEELRVLSERQRNES